MLPRPPRPVSHLDELRQELTGRGWITKLLDSDGEVTRAADHP